MRTPLLILIALLAGCASSPKEIIDSGRKEEFSSASGPRELAECTATRARSFSSYYTASVVEMVRPDNYQVVVMKTNWEYEPFIVAQTMPGSQGSQLTVYTSSRLDPIRTQDWIARLRKGCY
jgi:hypothetical protein